MITIQFNDQGTVEKIQDLLSEAKNPRRVMAGIGRKVENTLKSHFKNKNATEPNKLGGKRENYWNKVGSSVSMPVIAADGTAVTVSISDPTFAQKVFGGRIEAKNANALSIPQTPEAYGRRPSTFERETGLKLFLIHTSKGNTALAAKIENQGIQVEYILTPSVDQKPDPTALPDEAVMLDVIMKQAEASLKLQIKP